MGKINKYANLYNKEGKLIRKTSNGILKDITIPELEEMIDKYDGDKDSRELDNMKMMLFRMYNLYGNPHEAELIERIKAEAAKKTKPEEVTNKLQELNKDLEGDKTEDKTDEFEYVDEIPVGNGIWDQMETKAREYDPKQHEANLNKYMQQIAAA